MAGAFDWLDTLTSQIGDVAGRAVDAAGAVASAKIEAEQRRAVVGDVSPVPATSPLQTAQPGIVIPTELILLGGFVVVVFLIARME